MRRLALLLAVALATSCASDDGGRADEPAATTTPTTTAIATTTTVAAATTPTPATTVTTSAPEGHVDDLREIFVRFGADDPGCSAALSQDGLVVWAEGFGLADLDTGAPIDASTVFDIASTSKQFTATAALLLVEDGRLDLDATVRSVLDDLPTWADDVTIRQMIHHVSGIPDYIGLLLDAGYDFSDVATQADAVARLSEVEELEFEPGDRFVYSNSNYLLLGEIVARISGESLPAFLDERVFAPLGLDMVMDPTTPLPNKATSYNEEDGEWFADVSPWEQVGDGAIQTTPSELVRWASQYWDPTLGGPDLLAARSSGAVEAEVGMYGAGIVVEGEELHHDGSWMAFLTDLVIRPADRVAAAVTCNHVNEVGGPDPTQLAAKMLDAWLAAS